MKQWFIDTILNLFGLAYIWVEKYKEYPNDDTILGMKIDSRLQNMSRKQLCRYMDEVLPQRGFYELSSTTKIRLGCQLLRNLECSKKEEVLHSKSMSIVDRLSNLSIPMGKKQAKAFRELKESVG